MNTPNKTLFAILKVFRTYRYLVTANVPHGIQPLPLLILKDSEIIERNENVWTDRPKRKKLIIFSVLKTAF